MKARFVAAARENAGDDLFAFKLAVKIGPDSRSQERPQRGSTRKHNGVLAPFPNVGKVLVQRRAGADDEDREALFQVRLALEEPEGPPLEVLVRMPHHRELVLEEPTRDEEVLQLLLQQRVGLLEGP